MKFTVNDKTYFVKWEYGLEPNKNGYFSTGTFCKIYDNTTSFSEPLVESSCICNPNERFCKNTGRKISLDRALHKLFPAGYGRKSRAIAWQEYFKESPKRLK